MVWVSEFNGRIGRLMCDWVSDLMSRLPYHLPLWLLLCAAFPVKAENTSEQASDVRDEGFQAAVLKPEFPVLIQTQNAEIRELLEQYLPLLDYQRKEKLDREQIEYLAEAAPADALALLKTEGYFNPKIQLNERDGGFVVEVETGERTVVDNVNVAILGDILQDGQLGSYYKNAFRQWQLPVGSPFRQEYWAAGKESILGAVVRKKYPLAKFITTKAEVDPKSNKADLTVMVDSANPIYFGELEVSGTKRYPENVVRGLARFKPGDAYDLDKILDYQQALENDQHYSGASVQADFDRLEGDRVPVKVEVAENKRQKFEAGVRFDSAYGLGGNFGYEHYNVFNRGYTGSVYLDGDRYQTSFGVGLSQPRNSNGHYFTGNLGYQRSTTQRLERHTVTSGIWHVRDKNGIEARYGLEFVSESARVPESGLDIGKSYATMLTYSWKRQNIETAIRPANGYYLNAKVGTTLGKWASSSALMRFRGSAGYYFTPENKQLGTFVVRGQVAYVYSKEQQVIGNIPSILMFRTGGASSVRGYELDSIGLDFDKNTVLPDRTLAVASVEYQYPFMKDFAVAVFHDAGGVDDSFQRITFRHGTGLGLRWFSPAAPFSFDIAYGHHDKKVRWHISLGTRF